MSENHLLWRDGHKILGCSQPTKTTPDELFEELKMKHKPNQCPPIFHGDCKNAINEFVSMTRNIINARTGETAGATETEVAASFAVFVGLQNVAAYLSAAINNGSGEIAESLNRLARALENMTPVAEPPTLVRLRDVARRLSLSSDSVMRMSLKGEFPKPIYLDKLPFFRESEVNDWLASKAA